MNRASQFKIRLPADIKDWLQVRAQENVRSQSAEVIALLKAEMNADETKKADATA